MTQSEKNLSIIIIKVFSYEAIFHQAGGVWNNLSGDKAKIGDLFCP